MDPDPQFRQFSQDPRLARAPQGPLAKVLAFILSAAFLVLAFMFSLVALAVVAVLGVALLNINLGHNFLQSALYGFAAAVGFSLVMVLFAAIRERLAVADVPAPFRGNAIALITAGLMSLAFMGFSGLVKL